MSVRRLRGRPRPTGSWLRARHVPPTSPPRRWHARRICCPPCRPTRPAIQCWRAMPRPSPPRRSFAGSAISRRPACMAIAPAPGSMRTPFPRRCRIAAGGGCRPSRAGGDWPIAARSICFAWRASMGRAARRSTICARGPRGASPEPGHTFGRIHRDDIVRAVLAAMRQDRASGVRVLHLADDEPAESADVVAEAARLLGVAAPDCRAVRTRGGHDEPDGAQLLGGEPQGVQPADPADARPAVAVSELSRGTTRHPGRGAGRASGVAGPGPAGATGGGRRPSPGSPGRPGW